MGNRVKNNEKKKKKLPFGRNLFTLIFIALVLVLVAFTVSTITSYVKASNSSKYEAFVTQTISNGERTDFAEGTFNTVDERIKAKDFNTFGIELKCTNYVEDENTESTTRQAQYKISLYKYEDTPSIKNGTVSFILAIG